MDSLKCLSRSDKVVSPEINIAEKQVACKFSIVNAL